MSVPQRAAFFELAGHSDHRGSRGRHPAATERRAGQMAMNSGFLLNNWILYSHAVSGTHSLSASRCSSHEAAISEFLAFNKVIFVRAAVAGTGNNQMDYVLHGGRHSRKSSTFPGLMTLNFASGYAREKVRGSRAFCAAASDHLHSYACSVPSCSSR